MKVYEWEKCNVIDESSLLKFFIHETSQYTSSQLFNKISFEDRYYIFGIRNKIWKHWKKKFMYLKTNL